jgi:O-antigen ligase
LSGVELLLLAILAFLPWSEGGATPSALAILHTAVLSLGILVLWRSRREGRLELRLTWPLLAWILFLFSGGISFLGAEYLYGSFESYWDMWVVFILALSLSATRPSPRFLQAAPVMMAALAVAQAIPALVTRLTRGVSLSLSFLNPNHLAATLNVGALLALAMGGWLGGSRETGKGSRARLLWASAALTCVAGTVAIGSRGGILSMVVILGMVALRSRLSVPAAAKLLAVVALLVALAGAVSIGHRFAERTDPYRYDRPRLWRTAIQTWTEAPLAGLGPGMYEHRATRHNFPQELAVFRYSKQPRSAHSQPLQVLAEQGLIGMIALAAVVLAAFTSLRRAAGPGGPGAAWARATLLGAGVVGIHSLVEGLFQAPAIPLTLVVMLWMALDPRGMGDAPAALVLRWPRTAGGRMAIGLSVLGAGAALLAVAVVGPYLSYLSARYAESAGRPPVRIDLASRWSESFNPYQPFLGYRRARAALSRTPRISLPLLANAMDSLERTIRLEPGDPSAYVLLASLQVRSYHDLPGAGVGTLTAAGKLYEQAIDLSPLDARLWTERAGFRLMVGDPRAALSDCRKAVQLEPRSPAARLLCVEALLEGGREEEARRALAELDELVGVMEGYRALNGYEADLLKVDPRRLESVRSRLDRSVVFLPS